MFGFGHVLNPGVRHQLGERVRQERRIGGILSTADEERRHSEAAQHIRLALLQHSEAFAEFLAVKGITRVGDCTIDEVERRLFSCHALASGRGNAPACHVGPGSRRLAIPLRQALRVR